MVHTILPYCTIITCASLLSAGNVSTASEFSTLILPICVSLTVFSALTFILGLLLGALCTKCITQLHTKQELAPPSAHSQVPVYEEVPLQRAVGHISKIEENIAYGVIDNK